MTNISPDEKTIIDDMLNRRPDLDMCAENLVAMHSALVETFDRGVRAAQQTAAIVAPILGWDEATIAREIQHYEAGVAAEIESQRQPNDHTADAARMGAPDVRRMGRA